MQKFNLKLLQNKEVAVNCKTKEEAAIFIKWANSLKTREKDLKHDFHIYKSETCYKITEFLGCGFNDILDYQRIGWKILSFNEAKI